MVRRLGPKIVTFAEHTSIQRRAYTDCRFGQLHYLESRPAVAPALPLLLLHQNPSSSEEYVHLAREMGKDRRVIAFDTPGSGMSAWPSQPQPLEELAAAFADGLLLLGFDAQHPLDVYGYHTGTLLAAELALLLPDTVRRVVISGIPFRSDAERAARLEAARATPPLTSDGAAVLARFAALWKYVVTERHADMPLDRAAALFMEKAKSMHRFWWPYAAVWSYPIVDRFPKIRQPVLILQPREDLLEASREAAALLRDARFLELPMLSRDVFDVGIRELSTELRRFLG